MERKCKDLLREALQLHCKEVKDLLHQVESWKQRFEAIQRQKQSYQEECKILKKENANLLQTVGDQKEQIQKLRDSNRENQVTSCKMCDYLQKMNDRMTEMYTNNLQEKDKRIESLENQLYELGSNCSFVKQKRTLNITPVKAVMEAERAPSSSGRKQSPDSTCRITPNKTSPGQSESKEGKLRLKRKRKRNRYTEDPSPENKRSKNLKSKISTSDQILAPETCADEMVNEQQEISLCEDGNHAKNIVKFIPETVSLDFPNSEEDSETENQSTVVKKNGNRYSLRSVLFSTSSEESEGEKNEVGKQGQNQSDVSVAKQGVKNSTNQKLVKGSSKSKIESDSYVSLEKMDNLIPSSPVFQVRSRPNKISPTMSHKCADDHLESDVESPLLLKVTKISDENEESGSGRRSRLFGDLVELFDPDDVSILSDGEDSSESSGKRNENHLDKKTTKAQDLKSQPKKKAVSNSLPNKQKTNLNHSKGSPGMKQSTLSQIFMNGVSNMLKQNSAESDMQRAIELSLADTTKGDKNEKVDRLSVSNKIHSEQKENVVPFKRPSTPRKCKVISSSLKSPKVKKIAQRRMSISDPDETCFPVPDNAISKENNLHASQLNGSLDPDVHLSLLCRESQSLKDLDDLPDLDPTQRNERKLDSEKSQIGAVTDFRIEDLKGAGDPRISTCIDDETESQGIPCSSRSVKFGAGKKRFVRIPENFSEDISQKLNSDSKGKSLPDHDDSFDRVPDKEQPGFAYVDVVRKQNERQKLDAYECEECREYYGGMGLPEEEVKKRMKNCSRHRSRFRAPGTPEHFWDIDLEDTLECEQRGYIQTKDPDLNKPKYRRKRQLNKMFKSKKEEENSKQNVPNDD